MVTFLITLGVLLFINILLFTLSVNKPDKKIKKLVIEKNERIITHTQHFISNVENIDLLASKDQDTDSPTTKSEALLSE